jgi:polysaccharide export outer membrane protein
MDQVINNASENFSLQPGDEIRLIAQPRTYLSFGAGGKVSEVPFQSAHLSLAEAIARIGGPSPLAADPTAVYLFRFEQPSVTQKLNLPAVTTPIIYKVNMMDPQSYFEMQKIAMRNKDLIYVANASSNQFFRFMSAVNSVFIPIGTTANLIGN